MLTFFPKKPSKEAIQRLCQGRRLIILLKKLINLCGVIDAARRLGAVTARFFYRV
jgi:hypothetical protein